MSSTSRPSWQTDTCPAWCVSEHREEDLPEDRFHDSAGTYLTTTVQDSVEPGSDRNAELFMARFRRCNTREDWLHLATADDSSVDLTMSLESARRLGTALIERATTED